MKLETTIADDFAAEAKKLATANGLTLAELMREMEQASHPEGDADEREGR